MQELEARYRNGETVRKCNLDLAPDAPWRCPDDCPRTSGAWPTWPGHGSLVTPVTPPSHRVSTTASAAAVLDEAEDIINAAGPRIAEVQAEQAAQAPSGSFFRRK